MEDKEKSAEDVVAEMMNQPATQNPVPDTNATPANVAPAPAEQPVVENSPAEQPVEQPAEQPVEQVATQQEPVQQSVEQPVEQSMGQPVEPQSVSQPEPQQEPQPTVEQAIPGPAPMPEPIAQPVAQPAAQPMMPQQPMAQPVAQPVEQPMAQPSTQSDIFPDLSDINMEQSTPQIKAPSKKPIILALVAALVVIVGIIIVMVVMMNSGNKTNTNNNANNTENTPIIVPEEDEEELTEEELAAIKEEQVVDVKEVIDQLKEAVVGTNSNFQITDTTEENGYVAYKVDGAKVPVLLDEAYGFNASIEGDDAQSATEAASKAVEELLNDQGFEPYKEVTDLTGEKTAFYNEEKDIVCSPLYAAVYSLSISCANTDWYSEDDVALANDLVDAYNKSNDQELSFIGVRKALIKDSEVAPYQTVAASISDAVAEFYRVNPTSPWIFFGGTQSVRSCSDYNTDDLKAAYRGTTCFNEVDGRQEESKVE